MNNKKAFSILEVLVSTMILSMAVFGTYKLISENAKIIGNNNHYTHAHFLVDNTIACINKLGASTIKSYSTSTLGFHFGIDNNQCFIGNTRVIIDNREYQISGTIYNSGSNYIDWDIEIESDGIPNISKQYTQIGK